MWQVNAENLNLLNPAVKKNPFYSLYEKCADMVKDIFGEAGSVVLTFPDELIQKKDPYNSESREIKPTGIAPKFITRYIGGENINFDGHIRYYESIQSTDSQKESYLPRRFPFTGSAGLDVGQELDKIIYLLFISPHCKQVDELKSLQNIRGRTGIQRIPVYFEPQIPGKVVRVEVEIEKLVTRVRILIYDEERGIPMGKLRLIAAAMNVPNVGKMKDIEVQHALSTTLLAQHGGKYNTENLNEFINMSSIDKFTTIRALITRALDNDVIDYKEADSSKGKMIPGCWFFGDDENDKICEFGASYDPRNFLLETLEKDPVMVKRIETEIKKTEDKNKH